MSKHTGLEPYLDQHQLAERLGISWHTLANWRLKDKGPHYYRMGRTVRYPMSAVIKFEKKLQKK